MKTTPVDEPDYEFYAPHEPEAMGGSTYPTLRQWLDAMNQFTFAQPVPAKRIKPPAFWWRMKEDEGIDPGGINRIWNTRYNRQKQLTKWAVAPIEDFVAAGYARRKRR
jgi:hypothetical protein